MSWVTVQKGKDIVVIPYQAFKDIQEGQGFVVVDPTPPTKPTTPKKEKANDGRRASSSNENKR